MLALFQRLITVTQCPFCSSIYIYGMAWLTFNKLFSRRWIYHKKNCICVYKDDYHVYYTCNVKVNILKIITLSLPNCFMLRHLSLRAFIINITFFLLNFRINKPYISYILLTTVVLKSFSTYISICYCLISGLLIQQRCVLSFWFFSYICYSKVYHQFVYNPLIPLRYD